MRLKSGFCNWFIRNTCQGQLHGEFRRTAHRRQLLLPRAGQGVGAGEFSIPLRSLRWMERESAGCGRRGRVNENVVPCPGHETTETDPPCSWTRCVTMASPRPVPPIKGTTIARELAAFCHFPLFEKSQPACIMPPNVINYTCFSIGVLCP